MPPSSQQNLPAGGLVASQRAVVIVGSSPTSKRPTLPALCHGEHEPGATFERIHNCR